MKDHVILCFGHILKQFLARGHSRKGIKYYEKNAGPIISADIIIEVHINKEMCN